MGEKKSEKSAGKCKGFLGRLIEKMDKKLLEKAKKNSCCCGDDRTGKDSCCK
ncbi:MAG: hypothetical protein ABH865_05210 [Candidatus Omnitrophota bacterium]|nr:hypothetical protein [Candidatus Omnitrophota bacterium]